MTVGISSKDELYNYILDNLSMRGLTFDKTIAKQEGSYITQV